MEAAIVANFGTISQSGTWNLELNLVQWPKSKFPKYDIRSWSPDHNACSKGITMSKDELIKLRDLLNTLDI